MQGAQLNRRPARLAGNVVALTGAVLMASACSSTPPETVNAVVARVLDGDTFEVVIGVDTRTVQLSNVITPETTNSSDSAECLGAEARSFLEKALPVGEPVRLDYDPGVDTDGRIPAAVYVDNSVLVNAAVVREGLGIPVSDGDDRVLSQTQLARSDARREGRGLYGMTVECTVPGQVLSASGGVDCSKAAVVVSSATTSTTTSALQATSTPSSSSAPPPRSSATTSIELSPSITVAMSSAELLEPVEAAALALRRITTLRASIVENAKLLTWRALDLNQQQNCARVITELVDAATEHHQALSNALAAALIREESERTRAADEERAAVEAEAARVAEEQRLAAEAARVAEEQRLAAEAEAARVAEEQRLAGEVEAEQQRAAEAAARAEASRGAEQQQEIDPPANGESAPSSSDRPSAGNGPPGYTGPRCYAPGGVTWEPC